MEELTLSQLQQMELKILKDIHSFCVKENITYSLYGGTAIGAVRHKGFIPWDDDIDIVMPRADYVQFCKNYKSDHYVLTDRLIDNQTMLPFARVCDYKETVFETVGPSWHTMPLGVWVDIFPADGMCASDERLYERCKRLRKLAIVACVCSLPFNRLKGLKYNIKLLAKKIVFSNGKRAGLICDKLIKISQKYPFQNADYWAVLCCPYPRITYHPKATFSSVKLIEFEGNSFYILVGYDEMLKNVYGDYFKLPPIEQRIPSAQGYVHFYFKKD